MASAVEIAMLKGPGIKEAGTGLEYGSQHTLRRSYECRM